MQFPQFNNPFFWGSLKSIEPTAEQLHDRRYKPTVEAIYLKRSEEPDLEVPVLPKDGRVQVPIISGRPGDPNRHLPRVRQEEQEEDEYSDFRVYAKQYLDLQIRIQQIREKSAMYPIWASDTPSMPIGISRRFTELNQQLFNLRKCFVSPEEIMLDNTAIIIQRFWRSVFRKKLFRTAVRSIRTFKQRELAAAHRTLNSWMAQMEYADSKSQQLNFKNIARVSKLALKFWQRWSKKESEVSNRNEMRASELFSKIKGRRDKKMILTWRDTAMGPRSRKALNVWRQQMLPVMKRELEMQRIPVPHKYTDIVAAYVEVKSTRSFLFTFFLAWHTKTHSKSLKATVAERNAYIMYKKKLAKSMFADWLRRVRKTKMHLKTPEKWAKYIALSRSQHQSKMSRVGKIVKTWHDFARTERILRRKNGENRKKLTTISFRGWRETAVRCRKLKIETIRVWKLAIQDPKVTVFRTWKLWAVKKRMRKTVERQLDESHRTWHDRIAVENAFGKWQKRYAERWNTRADLDLQRKIWSLQSTKQDTTLLSGFYAREREHVQAIENELGDITTQFVASEEEVSRLEELSTTWKIALHAMKMELLRLAVVIQRCSNPQAAKRRRFSDEDCHDRLCDDDRYTQTTNSTLSMMQTSNRVIGKWQRRNSDPDFTPDVNMVDMKPPLDEQTLELFDRET